MEVQDKYTVLVNNTVLSVPLKTQEEAKQIIKESTEYDSFMGRKGRVYTVVKMRK